MTARELVERFRQTAPQPRHAREELPELWWLEGRDGALTHSTTGGMRPDPPPRSPQSPPGPARGSGPSVQDLINSDISQFETQFSRRGGGGAGGGRGSAESPAYRTPEDDGTHRVPHRGSPTRLRPGARFRFEVLTETSERVPSAAPGFSYSSRAAKLGFTVPAPQSKALASSLALRSDDHKHEKAEKVEASAAPQPTAVDVTTGLDSTLAQLSQRCAAAAAFPRRLPKTRRGVSCVVS